MTNTDIVTEGFILARRNWQLILVQFVMSLIGLAGLIVMVGIPVLIVAIIMGANIGGFEQLEDMVKNATDPISFLSQFMGLVLVVVTSGMVYLLFAVSLWIFTIGGSAGVLGLSLRHPKRQMGMRDFFMEGKRLFLPISWLTTIISAVFLVSVLILGLFAGGATWLWGISGLEGTIAAIILKSVFILLLVLASIALIFAMFTLNAWGVAALIFEGQGGRKAFRRGLAFLWHDTKGMQLMAMMIVGYAVTMIFVAFVGLILNLIPVLGMIISMPYQLFMYALQAYLGLTVMGSALNYYFIANGGVPQDDDSSGPDDILHPEASVPPPPQAGSDA